MEPWGIGSALGSPLPRGRGEPGTESAVLLRDAGEGPAELAHDARNMLTALELFCHLLEEPGVLAADYRHYGGELRLVAAASRRLVEKLAGFEFLAGSDGAPGRQPGSGVGLLAGWDRKAARGRREAPAAEPVTDLAAELAAKRNLLAALAGPSFAVSMAIHGGALPVRMTREDLTRVLVNLVRNSAEAMPDGGRLVLGLDEFHAGGGGGSWLVLTLEDDGPGIAAGDLEKVFHAGYTTRASGGGNGARSSRRGIGLSIARSIVAAAGGRIFAGNASRGGARFEIELPAGDG